MNNHHILGPNLHNVKLCTSPMLAVEDLLMGRWRSIFLKDSSRCSSYFLLRRSSTNAAAKSDATRSRSSNSDANTSVADNIEHDKILCISIKIYHQLTIVPSHVTGSNGDSGTSDICICCMLEYHCFNKKIFLKLHLYQFLYLDCLRQSQTRVSCCWQCTT